MLAMLLRTVAPRPMREKAAILLSRVTRPLLK